MPVFLQHQQLHDCALILRCTCSACLVLCDGVDHQMGPFFILGKKNGRNQPQQETHNSLCGLFIQTKNTLKLVCLDKRFSLV